LQGDIDETISDLEKYIPKEDGYLPKKVFVQDLETYLSQNKSNYQMLQKFIDPPKEYLPEDTQEAGLYFIEQLYITKKRLRRQANTLKIEIPESFGFSEDMPQDSEDVEALLKVLFTVEQLTTLLMEEKIAKISLIKPLRPVDNRDQETEKLFYREVPIQLSFLCDSPALIKFLYGIKNISPILIVKDIIIKREEESFLQVEMLLSRLII